MITLFGESAPWWVWVLLPVLTAPLWVPPVWGLLWLVRNVPLAWRFLTAPHLLRRTVSNIYSLLVLNVVCCAILLVVIKFVFSDTTNFDILTIFGKISETEQSHDGTETFVTWLLRGSAILIPYLHIQLIRNRLTIVNLTVASGAFALAFAVLLTSGFTSEGSYWDARIQLPQRVYEGERYGLGVRIMPTLAKRVTGAIPDTQRPTDVFPLLYGQKIRPGPSYLTCLLDDLIDPIVGKKPRKLSHHVPRGG